MPNLVEQLDRKTLDRFDLPKTFESQQGLDRLFLQKVLNLVYLVNDPIKVPHLKDIRAAADVTAGGALFSAPVNARRIVFSERIVYTATATVGTRNVKVDKVDKALDIFGRYISTTVAASNTLELQLALGFDAAGGNNVAVAMTYPIVLESEWSLRIDDTSNIDSLDDVSWVIEYVEIPI